MQSKPKHHPLVCAFSWAGVMLVVALGFLFAKPMFIGLTGAQPRRWLTTDDQWLSLGILVAVSFVAGLSLAWTRRHRQSEPIVAKQQLGASDV